MWTSGTKRKLEEEEGATYFSQRQSILDISMTKLRTQPVRRTEQPLRRSVLIFNTLKNIESELTLEGVRWNLPTRPSLLPAIQPSDLTLDPIPASPESKPPIERCGQEKHGAMDTTCRSPLVMSSTGTASVPPPQEVNSSPECTSPYSDNRSILDSFFNLPTSQQGPLPTFSSLFDLDSGSTASSTQSQPSTGYTSSSPTPSPSSSSSSSSSSSTSSSPHLPESVPSLSCNQSHHSIVRSSSVTSSHHHHHPPSGQHCPLVSSSDHDLFNDFDFSALDVDFFSVLQSNLRLPPLSADDLQSLAHSDSYGSSRTASCNPKHTDLGEDLDSIMQILVGI